MIIWYENRNSNFTIKITWFISTYFCYSIFLILQFLLLYIYLFSMSLWVMPHLCQITFIQIKLELLSRLVYCNLLNVPISNGSFWCSFLLTKLFDLSHYCASDANIQLHALMSTVDWSLWLGFRAVDAMVQFHDHKRANMLTR